MVANRKESAQDKLAVAGAVSRINGTQTNDTLTTAEHPDLDRETIVREDASELMVITKAKKLTAYVITVTEKSPKRFRPVFVSRMQNYCLDCMECLIEANSLRMDTVRNKEKRKDCQHNAYMKLKLLSYMAFLALENQCILRKQYEQISIALADCINLLVAWRKSDAVRNK